MGLAVTIGDVDITPAVVSLTARPSGGYAPDTATIGVQESAFSRDVLGDLLTTIHQTGAPVSAQWRREDGLVLYNYVGGEVQNPETVLGDPASLHDAQHSVPVQGWGTLLDVLGIEDDILNVPAGTLPEQAAAVLDYLRHGAPGDPGAEQNIDFSTYVEDLTEGATLPPQRFTMATAREMLQTLADSARRVDYRIVPRFTLAPAQVLIGQAQANIPYLYFFDANGTASIVGEYGTAAALATTGNLNMRPIYGALRYRSNSAGVIVNRAAIRNLGGRVVARQQDSAQALAPLPYSPTGFRLRLVRDSNLADVDLPDEALRQASKDAFVIPGLSFQIANFVLPGQAIIVYAPELARLDPAWVTGKLVRVVDVNLAWTQRRNTAVSQPLFDITVSERMGEFAEPPPPPPDLQQLVATSPAKLPRNDVRVTQAGVKAIRYRARLDGEPNHWVDEGGVARPQGKTLGFGPGRTCPMRWPYDLHHVWIVSPDPLPGDWSITATLDGSPVTFPITYIPAHALLLVTLTTGAVPTSLVVREVYGDVLE